MKFLTSAAALALLAFAAPVAALTTVYTADVNTPGTQDYGDTLGLNFNVNYAVKVFQFGAFDSGRDGITTNIKVVIFNRDTGADVSPFVSFLGTLNPDGAAYVFKDVTPFILGPGHYQLAAFGYNAVDQNYNAMGAPGLISFNSFGGALTGLDAKYGIAANGTIGTQFDAGIARYGAGTLVIGSVPEPMTWALMVAGFGMVGVGMRRRTAVTV